MSDITDLLNAFISTHPSLKRKMEGEAEKAEEPGISISKH